MQSLSNGLDKRERVCYGERDTNYNEIVIKEMFKMSGLGDTIFIALVGC